MRDESSLYFLLNFSVKLKLLYKIKFMNLKYQKLKNDAFFCLFCTVHLISLFVLTSTLICMKPNKEIFTFSASFVFISFHCT